MHNRDPIAKIELREEHSTVAVAPRRHSFPLQYRSKQNADKAKQNIVKAYQYTLNSDHRDMLAPLSGGAQ